MERIVLCLICGIEIGALVGWFLRRYAEKQRRRHLPICEVRKAPDVLYVHEKKTTEAASTEDSSPSLQGQRGTVPRQRNHISPQICTTECFFEVQRSNPGQQRSPVLPQSGAAQERKKPEQKNADSEKTDWMGTVRPWITVSVFCCGGIALLHTVQLNRRKRTREGRRGF